MMNRIQLISDLSNAFGPSGFEDDVLAVVRRYAPAECGIEEDSLRNLYLTRKENTGRRPVLQLDAHTDEVGFMVQAVRPNGTLKFIPLGGWVNSNIPAHKVKVRARDGSLVTGVTAAKPPHFMTAEEKNRMPALEEMSIDVGASSIEEARDVFGVRVAAPVAPDVTFEYDEKHDLMIGKAFDNRLGCAAIQATLAALRTVAWFVDCGDDDFLLQLSMDFHMKMREVKVHNELRVRNGVHNWEYWHLALRMSLPFASRNFGEN